jgi:hypothetical protein
MQQTVELGHESVRKIKEGRGIGSNQCAVFMVSIILSVELYLVSNYN